ncbi:MAG: NAD-dependent epimerase/dehydratase family protein [Rhodospirillaceae bacterium]
MTTVSNTALYDDCARSLGNQGAAALSPLRHGTLVITGGTGFVGLWMATLCAFLNDCHGFNLKLVLTARRYGRLVTAAPHLVGRADLRFVSADIRQFIEMPSETSWIIHAAGTPDSRIHLSSPMETMAVIAEGTYRILRVAEQCDNLRMMLHLSSALVYGTQPLDMASLPEDFTGTLNPAAVTSAYAEAKRYSEALCVSARSQSRTPLIITRPFTFLGPFQSLEAPWALNNFLYSALHNQPLKVLGDGRSVRSHFYGSDMAFLLLRILSGGRSGGLYNLGHPIGTTLSELAELVVRVAGVQLDIRYNTAGRQIAASRLIPDMTRCHHDFGFTSTFTLTEAIERTLAWNRRRQDEVMG